MERDPEHPDLEGTAAPRTAPTPDWASPVWDVLVVGAGPAGSSAARTAAEAGASVLLLDRSPFPRYKTCGGGLLGESLRLIPERARATIESRVADTRFTSRFGRPFRLRRADPYLAMVQRIEFDQALVEAAQDAGARFVDGVAVREITQPGDDSPLVGATTPEESVDPADDAAIVSGSDAVPREPDDASDPLITVRTTAGTVRARVVIGADGTGGRVGRYVGVTPGGIDLGLEDEIAMPADDTRWRDTVYLDWGGASGSYAWVFPKGESLTVGVIQRKGAPDATRDYLAAWRAHLGLAGARTLHSSGHLTQWRTDSSPLRRGRVLVAGDAAGLLEPWTREGISFALRSGAWAGAAAAGAKRAAASTPQAAGDPAERATPPHPPAEPHTSATPRATTSPRAPDDALAAYEARVLAELGAEQRAGAAILATFERHRGLVHTLLRTPWGARYFVRFCRGETSLARFARHRWAMRLVRSLD
ncbi:geranylgeranyl reductase family protein [Herbiconiux sp. CPCC 205763]|uniref:Geranylgeranyl reductase family protein n=1 Tax=Herbiconiux aconitum TaxID=2970913 RepID=A0ABT2GYD0_9MICO|nr:geranylgeranyl reductase family protein [Herbiconiux aconitum]MCS5719944.1 geranylgeranyl reductase family protein [Herbiconiux aconitum]